ncbi:hypothetical protein LVB87_12580 [Lysobacter sp. KIS68-7]|uniref:hypothetical protein n=1 Tax=Lysobacter sp. KIS68-7 TaxID=2904252 RepID=UPI001E645229|nr:hypothetical protein [Lysobacter sp. KIS68-7]UHQ19011.1 hypothetical protein LVB87_12580 [Lysobacter sp. KIS68-7]
MNFQSPDRHLNFAKSLIAAARDQLARYFCCTDAHSPDCIDGSLIVKAADLLDAAADALNGEQG